jgi:hypothetical protein
VGYIWYKAVRVRKGQERKGMYGIIYTEYYECDKIKDGEMGEACNTHGEVKSAYKS